MNKILKNQIFTHGNTFGNLLILVILPLSMIFFSACAENEVSQDDPEAVYKEGDEMLQDERYFQALEKFRDVKNRFPYHSRAIDAELKIADTYFAQEAYLESASAYEIFKELHPAHPKSDYVQYRIGLSYFNQIPENSARDLSAAYRAIDNLEIVPQKYPSSEFASKAKEQISLARARLAEHENYVADFYYRKKHYLSATYRYQALLRDFPKSEFEEEALMRLGRSYVNVRMFGNAKDALNRLLKDFPTSPYVSEAQGLLADISSGQQ